MDYLYRRALPEDADACIDVRGRTRENALSADQLTAIGVTLETWADGIRDGTLPGHLCLYGSEIAGYCFGVRDRGEIAVLAVLPEHEGRGIGRTLLSKMIEDFEHLGCTRLFLGCSSNSRARSYGFYRHLGWRSTGALDAAHDEVLELFLDTQARDAT